MMLLFSSCLSLVPPSWLLPPSSSPPCLHHSNSLTPFSSLPPSLPPPIPRALSLCLSLGPDPRITVKWCIPRELGGALIGKEGGREGGREGYLASNFVSVFLHLALCPFLDSPALPPCLPPAGKRGATLTHISTESGARLRLGHEEELPPGNNHERIVYVTGRKTERDKALAMIQEKVRRFLFLPPSLPSYWYYLVTWSISQHSLIPLPPCLLLSSSRWVGGHHFGQEHLSISQLTYSYPSLLPLFLAAVGGRAPLRRDEPRLRAGRHRGQGAGAVRGHAHGFEGGQDEGDQGEDGGQGHAVQGGWVEEGGKEGGRVRCVGLLVGSRGAKMKEIKQGEDWGTGGGWKREGGRDGGLVLVLMACLSYPLF